MAQINPAFVQKTLELTSIAYKLGIDCPALHSLNDWTIKQFGNGATTMATRLAKTEIGSFDNAVLDAVRTSDGVSLANLSTMLASWNRPNNLIGAALGRLKRQGKITQSGDLWRIKKATRARTTSPKVDKTLPQRRQRRTAKTTTAAVTTGQPVAAAG